MSDNTAAVAAGASAAKLAGATTTAAAASFTDIASILRFIIGSCLSYGVVVGASLLKVPQIVSVARRGSAEGISLFANYVELLSYVISTSWGVVQGLPFRDFGENVLIFVQLIVLVLVVARLQGVLPSAIGAIAADICLFYVMCQGVVPQRVHESLLSAQILLNISSRVPQMILNYRNESTGQLSFLTFFLAFGGGVARVLTTALNVPWAKGKGVMLVQFSVAASLNLFIIAQILYYGHKATSGARTKAAPKRSAAARKKD